MLHPNDIIPLGVAPGVITLLVNDNGLGFLPSNAVVVGKGDGGYYNVDVQIRDAKDRVALRMLGVSVTDINSAEGLL